MPVPLLGRAIRRRHSAVDEERGGHVVARHICTKRFSEVYQEIKGTPKWTECIFSNKKPKSFQSPKVGPGPWPIEGPLHLHGSTM